VSSAREKVRVTTWTFGADGVSTGQHRHEFDYVVVPITGGAFIVNETDGSVREMAQVAGSSYLGTAGTAHDVANTPGHKVVFVEIELKR
jgi:beta-alanine degradation protein BauB